MRFYAPGKLALLISLILTAIILAAALLLQFMNVLDIGNPGLLLLMLIPSFLSYFLIRFAVNRFLYSKINIIYKTIHDLKNTRNTGPDINSHSPDLEELAREVSEWAVQRKLEIRELRDREKFRREFIGNISHELKTPVFNIQGYLLTLLDGAMDDEEINRKYLKRANKSVDRMIHMIDDMEMISKLESNRINIDKEVFDLMALIKDVMEMLEDKAKSNKASLILKKDYEKPVKVLADRQKIEQVLTNLILNAIKYGKPKKGVVEIRVDDMHSNIMVEVSDDGPGIPAKDIPRIFERFYRVDKSRSREAGGTGLGLSIVKHIIEAHQQTINVRSEEGRGTTFSFTLKKAK